MKYKLELYNDTGKTETLFYTVKPFLHVIEEGMNYFNMQEYRIYENRRGKYYPISIEEKCFFCNGYGIVKGEECYGCDGSGLLKSSFL